MAGEQDEKSASSPEAQTTARVDALSSRAPGADDPDALVELHRRTAARLLKEGAAARAFAELVVASREIPMTRRLAALLAAISLKAGTESVAITLLTSGVQENEGAMRIDIRRQLVRLLRKTGELDRAREELVLILAEKAGDRRARRSLNALLERGQLWELLDASLEKEALEAFRRGALRRAARASLARGRLWGERLANDAHAAVRYGQAAELLDQARDFEASFNVRLLWIRSLAAAQVPQSAMEEAVQQCIASGARVGKEHRARALLGEMGLLPAAPSPLAQSPLVPATLEVPLPPAPAGAPAAPAAPTAPVAQPAPVVPMSAVAPVAPAAQKTPAAPVGPAAQKTPAAPVGPVAQTTPAVPVGPAVQRTPAAPVGPVAQVAPAAPLAPALTAAPAAPASQGRRSTQRELLAAAEEAEARGKRPEAAALFSAAVAEGPDPDTLRRLEAHYVARGAWRELSHFYRDRAAQVADPAEKAELLARMAELLEDELQDPAAAARAYGEIVRLTGDERALREQVRLLAARQDFAGMQQALDLAVEGAPSEEARASALVARGEAAVSQKEVGRARRDFEQALRLSPSHLGALVGFAEATAERGVLGPALALRDALAALPRRQPGRMERLRRLARLADAKISDLELARWAWAEVLAEAPQDAVAQRRLMALARKVGDAPQLEQLLRTRLDREPRGKEAREAWRELARLLEKGGRSDEALELLRQAVRFEPGHKEAWLLLADRLAARQRNGEAAWAYEQAATSTEDEAERQQAWAKLARFCRDVLGDRAKANVYALRAENLRQAMAEAAAQREGSSTLPPLPPEPVEPAAPAEPPAAARSEEAPHQEEVVTDPGLREGGGEAEAEAGAERGAPGEEGARGTEEVGGEGLDPDRSRGVEENRRTDEFPIPQSPDFIRTEEFPILGGGGYPEEELDGAGGEEDDDDEPEPTWAGRSPYDEQERLFEQVHAQPLSSPIYRALAEYFEDMGDPERGGLMGEIASALEGRPAPAPRVPHLILSAADRATLRHPFLRGEEGELLGAVGVALCRLFSRRSEGDGQEFRVDAGRGAPSAAEALVAAVRILGLRAPQLYLSREYGPPFALDFARTPRLLVGRAAVERQLSDAELRFFAGRALFSQNPDLLVLRYLTPEQLEEGFVLLESALREDKPQWPESRQLRELLPRKGLEELRELYERVCDSLDLEALAEGARHSANRAGLVVCGGVGPALAALRAKRSPDEELVELVRFAASERYLKLRQRHLG